jgi:hypothetical protein
MDASASGICKITTITVIKNCLQDSAKKDGGTLLSMNAIKVMPTEIM